MQNTNYFQEKSDIVSCRCLSLLHLDRVHHLKYSLETIHALFATPSLSAISRVEKGLLSLKSVLLTDVMKLVICLRSSDSLSYIFKIIVLGVHFLYL